MQVTTIDTGNGDFIHSAWGETHTKGRYADSRGGSRPSIRRSRWNGLARPSQSEERAKGASAGKEEQGLFLLAGSECFIEVLDR